MGGNVPGLFKYVKDTEGNSNQSSEFRNVKAHINAHFCKKVHVENWEAWEKAEAEKSQFEIRCKEVGLRIARLCYDIYRDGKSLCDFEK